MPEIGRNDEVWDILLALMLLSILPTMSMFFRILSERNLAIMTTFRSLRGIHKTSSMYEKSRTETSWRNLMYHTSDPTKYLGVM